MSVLLFELKQVRFCMCNILASKNEFITISQANADDFRDESRGEVINISSMC